MRKLPKQDVLTTLWIFVLINILFADIFGFMLPGSIAELMTGTVDGIKITTNFMFLAAIMNVFPILMILVSKFMNRKPNRILNLIFAVYTIAYIVGGASFNIVYYFFATVEIIALLAILRTAFTWKED